MVGAGSLPDWVLFSLSFDTSSKFANAPPPIETEAALVELARKAKATDVVIFIYRQEYYEERAEPKSSGSESSLAFHERYAKWQENLGKCKNIAVFT